MAFEHLVLIFLSDSWIGTRVLVELPDTPV